MIITSKGESKSQSHSTSTHSLAWHSVIMKRSPLINIIIISYFQTIIAINKITKNNNYEHERIEYNILYSLNSQSTKSQNLTTLWLWVLGCRISKKWNLYTLSFLKLETTDTYCIGVTGARTLNRQSSVIPPEPEPWNQEKI